MKKLFFLTCCIATSASPFDIKEQWNKVSHWFKPRKTEATTYEYALEAGSTLFITNTQGSITLKGWNQKNLMIEAVKKGDPEHFSKGTLAVRNAPQKITVTTHCSNLENGCPIDLIVMVPVACAQITAIAQKGEIKVKKCPTALELTTDKGNITIRDSKNTVTAKTTEGSVTLEQTALAESDTIFLETASKGGVHLKLAPGLNARLQAQTHQGSITSSVYVTLDPRTVKLNEETWKEMKKNVAGTIGSGGAPIIIDVEKGSITIDHL